MDHDTNWLAARMERARGEAQVRRLLLLALEAFNARPRFAVPSERTDSYAIAARLGRWVGIPGDPSPCDLHPSGGPLFRSARRRP